MLELGVVAQRAIHEVVLDQRVNELVLAVGVAEVHPRARAGDRRVADNPVPGRALGVDANNLHSLVEVREAQPLDQDVVNGHGGCLGLDAVASLALAVERQVAQGDIARVLEAHDVPTVAPREQGGRAARGTLDDDALAGLAVLVPDGEALSVGASGELEPVARKQPRDQRSVGRRGCLDGSEGATPLQPLRV